MEKRDQVIIILAITIIILVLMFCVDEYWDYKLDKTAERLGVCQRQRLELQQKYEQPQHLNSTTTTT